MDASFRAQRDKEEKWSWERSVEHGCSLSYSESQAPLGCESHIFFAGCVGSTSAARRADGCADQSAFATACQSTDEGPCSRSAADHFQIPLLMRATLYKNTGGLYGQQLRIN